MTPPLQQRDWKNLVTDVRLWVGLFFIIRLFGITNPPLDPATTIRQVDVLTISRNFYEIDANIFYPRIDVAGKSEIVGVEFPIYNYLIYLVALLFGYDHWYGRIINLIVTSVALLCFHDLLRRWFDKWLALNATLVFLFSTWFAYSRVTLPDIFAASLCIISLNFAFRYVKRIRWLDFALFFVLACLGCLSKITSASLLTVLLIPILSREVSIGRKVTLIAGGFGILVIVCVWYFYWVPHLNSIGAHYFFMGKQLSEGIRDVIEAPLTFAHIIFADPLNYVGGVAMVASVVYAIRARRSVPLFAFLLPFLAYCILILKLGNAFYINGYYYLMFVPPMALIAGFGISAIKNKYIYLVVLSAIAIENIANQYHIFEKGPPYNTYAKLESIFDSIGSERSDLIAVGSADGYPMPTYMAHRKGWYYSNEYLANRGNVVDLQTKGCKYILLLRKIHPDGLQLPYPIAFDSEDFTIYKL